MTNTPDKSEMKACPLVPTEVCAAYHPTTEARDGCDHRTTPTPDEICERLFGRLGVFYMARTAWAEKNWTDKVDEVNEAERKLRALIQQQQADIERLSAALEWARLDLNHLAEKYGEQEFIAPTICKITALGKDRQ